MIRELIRITLIMNSQKFSLSQRSTHSNKSNIPENVNENFFIKSSIVAFAKSYSHETYMLIIYVVDIVKFNWGTVKKTRLK